MGIEVQWAVLNRIRTISSEDHAIADRRGRVILACDLQYDVLRVLCHVYSGGYITGHGMVSCT